MSALPLGLRLIPVQRLNIMALGIVANQHFHNVTLAKVVALHQRIDDPARLASNPSADPIRSFLLSHILRVQQRYIHTQAMCNNPGSWLRFVEHSDKILVTIIDFSLEFVAGLQAQDGLSRKGERPATGEPATSSVVLFLRCF
jgi:hypothetical protein